MYSKVSRRSPRLGIIREKNRAPQTWPDSPMRRLKAIANTLRIHRMIADRLSPSPGRITKWKWFPMMQKLSSRKSYLAFALFTAERKSSFIAAESRIISLRLTLAVTW